MGKLYEDKTQNLGLKPIPNCMKQVVQGDGQKAVEGHQG
jgi:hypothetical protein